MLFASSCKWLCNLARVTFLFLFLALFVGINIRFTIALGIIELVVLLLFVFWRAGKKIALLTLGASLIGVGLSFVRPSFNKEAYLSVVTESKNNYFIANSTSERFYIYHKDNPFEIGDIVLLKGEKGKLDFTTLESDFDFGNYLNQKGIYSQFYPEKIEVKFKTPFRIHQAKLDFLGKFNKNSQALVGSILFSMSSDEDVYQSGKELHLFRLLSNSGIYLSFLYFVLSSILSYIIKKDKAKKIVLIVLFVPVLIFSFPRFIVIKFIFLKIFRWINEYVLKKKFDYLEVLSLSGIIFLLINYHYAYQDAFILAYFIPLESFFFMNSFKGIKKLKKKILVSGLILASFIPFAISYYHEVAPFSIVFQILLTPLFVIYYFLSLIAFIRIPIYQVINGYSGFMSLIFNAFGKINLKIYAGEINSTLIVLFEVLYLILVYYISIRHKPMYKIAIVPLTIYLAVSFIPFKSLFMDMVSFINVGQGDATLIRRRNTAILIDTGGLAYKDVSTDCLIPYFKKNRIYDIDLLITTHDDFDHSGAASSLIKNFTVKRYVKDIDSFPISINGLQFKNYNIYPNLWKEENDESLVIGFKTNNYNYLVMGDAPIKIEKEIMKGNEKIPCDILKVGHHGSKTSTSEAFIKYLKPKVGIISCGKKNKFGHPHEQVVAILKKYHVKIRRTDLEGTITYWQ